MTQYSKLLKFLENERHFKLIDVVAALGCSEVYARQLLHKAINNGIIKLKDKGLWSTIRSDEEELINNIPNLSVPERFAYLRELVSMVVKKIQPSMLLMGTAGVGKTWLVLDTLKKYGLKQDEDYFVCKGHSSPLGLYQTLHDHRDSVLILDDYDSVFKNDISTNILKAGLDSYNKRFISWQSSRADAYGLERTFEFEGQIIFISNLSSNRIDDAIKSRAFCYSLHLNPDEMHQYMQHLLPNIIPEIPLEQKQEVLDYLYNYRNVWNNYNLRSLIQAIRIRAGTSEHHDWKKLVQVLSEGAL